MIDVVQEFVILVDQADTPIGIEEKMKAHREGTLHRAFSIFIVNSRREMLLQRRAFTKYHSGGLWTNACCSHPRPDEDLETAVHRRLQEELGFDCPLEEVFHFVYCASLDQGLTEHEFDHVFMGVYDGEVVPNRDEVEAIRWVRFEDVQTALTQHPDEYAIWFRIAFQRFTSLLQRLKL